MTIVHLKEQILLLVSTPLYVIIIGLEVLLSNYRHRKRSYTWKDTFTNLYLMLLNGGIDLLFRATYLMVLDVCY
ncbi:MAG TPA: hypothetical protein VHC48_23685, partial [Puia sp.]|nr:hypothetical protein [Puia sp.]